MISQSNQVMQQQESQPSIRRVQQSRKNGAMSVSLNPEWCQLTNLQKQDFITEEILRVKDSVALILRKVEGGLL